MRKKQSKDKDFELIKKGVFNSDYPRNYNLLLGYSTLDVLQNTAPCKDDIKIVID